MPRSSIAVATPTPTRPYRTATAQKGQPKEGDQAHVHIIVSRFAERQAEQERSASLSPLTNHRRAGGAIGNGFDRVNFIQANERAFDQKFSYQREPGETFDHARAAKSQNQAERLTARDQAIKAQIDQARPQRNAAQPQRSQDRAQDNHQNQSNSLSR